MPTDAISELEQKLKQLKIANKKLERNSRGSVFESIQDFSNFDRTDSTNDSGDAVVEETTLIRLQQQQHHQLHNQHQQQEQNGSTVILGSGAANQSIQFITIFTCFIYVLINNIL